MVLHWNIYILWLYSKLHFWFMLCQGINYCTLFIFRSSFPVLCLNWILIIWFCKIALFDYHPSSTITVLGMKGVSRSSDLQLSWQSVLSVNVVCNATFAIPFAVWIYQWFWDLVIDLWFKCTITFISYNYYLVYSYIHFYFVTYFLHLQQYYLCYLTFQFPVCNFSWYLVYPKIVFYNHLLPCCLENCAQVWPIENDMWACRWRFDHPHMVCEIENC